MERRLRRQRLLRSALGYGGGAAAGTLLVLFLLNDTFTQLLTTLLVELQLLLYLLFSILSILIIIGLGGWLGGALGGYNLATLIGFEKRRRFMWRSGASFLTANMIIVVPALLLTALVGFLNPALDNRLSHLPTLFIVFGLLYGAIAGLLLGLLIVGLRHTLSVLLAGVVGFGLGGLLLGLGLFLYFKLESPSSFVTLLVLLLLMFLFGASGGSSLALAFRNIQDERSLLPNTRNWRIVRRATLAGIAILSAFALGKLVLTLTVVPASLQQRLPLRAVSTHWLPDRPPTSSARPPATGAETAVCDPTGRLRVTLPDTPVVPSDFPACSGRPALVEAGDGRLHLVWYSSELRKVSGALTEGHYLYEAIADEAGWSEPLLVAASAGPASPALALLEDGGLHLSWTDNAGAHEALQPLYDCSDAPLTAIGEAVLTSVNRARYRPQADPVPFCGNQYDRLLITPNPTAPDSPYESTPQGAFDTIAALVETAEYEVLFTTMQWDTPSDSVSPGRTLAQAVNTLYEKVKANPEAYPRGMTVRILLGNLPVLGVFEPLTQLNHVFHDLELAGLPELENEELGWQVEIANFDGAWPHAHSKFVVVDGRHAIAGGYNYSYLHLPSDHPSGQGLDMSDKGLQITGPVAQSALVAFDDLWAGSDRVACRRTAPFFSLLRFLYCDTSRAVSTHVPEVLRFQTTESADNAFALHHTSAFLESDNAILEALTSAEATIDLYQVNFSLDLICILALLVTDFCTAAELAPPYMHALVTAVVENDVQIRLLLEPSAFNGFENRIGLEWFLDEIAAADKLDNVSVRWFDGKMHDKAVLLDGEFLVIGSQNFHYSAWDEPSLTEYNLATEAPRAISDFLSEYEYQWQQGTPYTGAGLE